MTKTYWILAITGVVVIILMSAYATYVWGINEMNNPVSQYSRVDYSKMGCNELSKVLSEKLESNTLSSSQIQIILDIMKLKGCAL